MNQNILAARLQIAAALLLTGLAVVFALSFVEPNVQPGDSAPSFTLTTDSGRTVTAKQFGGKILVLNFWASWCSPCVEEMPSLNAMAQRLAPQGVVVVGVSVDKNEASYRRLLKQQGIRFEVARDAESRLSADYGTFKYPETYVIDATGKVRQKHIGPRDWTDAELVRSIEKLL